MARASSASAWRRVASSTASFARAASLAATSAGELDMSTVQVLGDAASGPRRPVVLAAAVELLERATAAGVAAARALAASAAMLPALKIICAIESEQAAAPGAPAVVDVDRLTVHFMAASQKPQMPALRSQPCNPLLPPFSVRPPPSKVE